MILQAF